MASGATRRVRYQVAASLDGYVAAPDGKADWIPMDPDIDFGALFAQFDTVLMGRRTFEATTGQGQSGGGGFGMKTVVVSRTLKPAEHPGVTVVADGLAEAITALKAQPGKDIWLFGGGTPLVPPPLAQTRLKLDGHRLYEKSGIMLLEYSIERM